VHTKTRANLLLLSEFDLGLEQLLAQLLGLHRGRLQRAEALVEHVTILSRQLELMTMPTSPSLATSRSSARLRAAMSSLICPTGRRGGPVTRILEPAAGVNGQEGNCWDDVSVHGAG